MVDIIKKCIAEKVEYLEARYVEKSQACDIITELDDLQTEIIMTAAFGVSDKFNSKLPYV